MRQRATPDGHRAYSRFETDAELSARLKIPTWRHLTTSGLDCIADAMGETRRLVTVYP